MAVTYKVEMLDGATATADRRPVHMLRVERLMVAADRDVGMQEQALMIVWAAVTGGAGTLEEFDAWVEQVADWERVEAEADPPASGSDTSPD